MLFLKNSALSGLTSGLDDDDIVEKLDRNGASILAGIDTLDYSTGCLTGEVSSYYAA